MKSFRQVATGGSAVSLVKFKSPLIPAPRWTFSLLLGIAVHLLAALMLIGWVHHVTPQGMLPPAVIMDLAMYQQMATPAADVPPGPEQNMAAPERVKQPEKKSEDLPKLTRSPQGAQAIRTELQVKKAKPTPELNDLPLPVVARNSAPTTSAPLPGQSQKNSASFTSPSAAAVSGQVNWNSDVLAHLARYKRYPREALRYRLQGVSHVRFKVTSAGNVIAAELLSSSGERILDREAMRLIARAQPLPPPPTELLRNGVVELIAPIAYDVKN